MAARLRVVARNLAKSASIVATSEVGNMLASNLKKGNKATVWRGTSKVESLKLRWLYGRVMSAVALPHCNLSPTALMRVRGTNEYATTNLYRYSEQIDNAAWIKASVTCAGGAINLGVAPDGTQTADKVVESAVTGTHYLEQTVSGIVTGQPLATSFFVKSAGRTYVRILVDSATTAAPAGSATFNLTNGAVTSVSGTSWTFTAEAFPDGWYRLKAVATATASGVARPRLQLMSSVSTTSYLGDVNYGVYVWGGQFEINSSVTSYFPSGATSGERPTGYTDTWQSYQVDTGYVTACAAPGVTPVGFTEADGASAYLYGGGNTARVWFNPMGLTGMSIDIQDNGNLQGYIEAAMLVVGEYWSPARNPSWGNGLTPIDRSKNQVMESGTLKSYRGTRSKKLTMNLNNMEEADRAYFTDMLLENGITEPIFACLFPESDDKKLEQHYTIMGKMTALSAVTMPYWNAANAPLELEQV